MHWAFPPVVGGVESHLIYLYKELADRGHEISLLTAPHPARDDKSVGWIKITSDEYMSLPFLQGRIARRHSRPQPALFL